MSEEDELLSEWEKATSKKLEAMERDIAEIKKLVTKPEPAKAKPLKPARPTVKELIAKSTPFLSEFNVNRFIELAQKESLTKNDDFSDEDIALISSAIGEPLLILDEAERDDAISLLCNKLGIEPSRFKAVAEKQEEIWLSVDEEFWTKEEKEPLSSDIKVVVKEVSEETPEEEEE